MQTGEYDTAIPLQLMTVRLENGCQGAFVGIQVAYEAAVVKRQVEDICFSGPSKYIRHLLYGATVIICSTPA